MARELCPACRALTTVRVTVTSKVVTAPDGTKKKVRVETFHCESCRRFIRSTETDEPGKPT